MISVSFNPFKSELSELSTSDLEVLKSVAEGWYIEYKREIVKSKNIAKSLAAFANHYGGWLIYGITATTDGSNLADSFPGIANSEVSTCLEKIRDAAKDCINPCPYYEYKVLSGPFDKIGLSYDRSVIVILVPSGSDAPYVHSDGRIYRRIADSSDPKPETDRFILDQLWQRRQQAHDRLKIFLNERPELSRSEEGTSFVHLFLSIDPLGVRGHRVNLTFDKFKELMANPPKTIGIPFDNFFAASDGIVCRQVGINDPFRLLLTFKYNLDASAQISIPISSTSIFELTEFGLRRDNILNGYEQAENLVSSLEKQRFRSGELLDVNNLFFIITAILRQYEQLLDESKVSGPIYAKAVLENIWRRIPFLDTQEFIEHVERNGFPLIQSGESFAPPGNTFDSLDIITPKRIAEDDNDVAMVQHCLVEASGIMGSIANALGIPMLVIFDPNGNWIRAGNRASLIAQKRLENNQSEKQANE